MPDARKQFAIHEQENSLLFCLVVDFPFKLCAYEYFKSKTVNLCTDK